MSDTTENLGSAPGSAPKCPCVDWNAIVARVKEVLLDPRGVWTNIKAESISVKELYLKYFMVLAAVPAICQLIIFHSPFFASIIHHVMFYAFGLGMMFVFALVIEKLAPNFGGSTDRLTALKLIGFAAIPAWIGGLFILLPSWALYSLLALVSGVYSLYTFWQGITPMTGVGEAKRVPFFLTLALVCAVVSVVCAFVFSMITPSIRPNITIDTPQGKIDLNELQQKIEQFQKMLPQGEN